MKEIREKVFNRENMIITFIGNKKDYLHFKTNIDKYLEKINNKHYEEVLIDNKISCNSKAFVIDKKVNYIQ